MLRYSSHPTLIKSRSATNTTVALTAKSIQCAAVMLTPLLHQWPPVSFQPVPAHGKPRFDCLAMLVVGQ